MRAIIILLCLAILVSGCAVNLYKTTPRDKSKIRELEDELSRQTDEKKVLESEVERLQRLREQEREEFERIRKELKGSLRDRRIGLEVGDRGLVITLADNILFDSGKADIKEEAFGPLDKIMVVLQNSAAKKNIGVEGHTDNVPIKFSGWKSNRELSTARSNNVYHYIVEKGIDPARVTTMGYGEYRPIASNETEKGRKKNRRVEIVILAEFAKTITVDEQVDESFIK